MRHRIEAFAPDRHDTKGFRCGSASQENVLRRRARRHQRDGYTRLLVATSAEDSTESRVVLGFYAINAHAIGTADLPAEAAPRAPRSNLITAVFLSHLAVDRKHQGQGLGRILPVEALQQCQRVEEIPGVRLLLLDVAWEGGEELRARLIGSTPRWASSPCLGTRSGFFFLSCLCRPCRQTDERSGPQIRATATRLFHAQSS